MQRYSNTQIIIIVFSVISIAISASIVAFYYLSQEKRQENTSCTIQECHGPYYSCGEKPTYACSGGTQIGDLCEQFAVCEEINSNCALKKNEKLEKCQKCSITCTNFECVSNCINSQK